jgi:uncharacterized membrane protein YdjX (TVP38/TMEM64 family)
MKSYSAGLLKLSLSILSFFVITYLVFDFLFDITNRVEWQLTKLPATWTTALIIIALLVADMLIPVPSSIVMILSGALFGGFLGGLIALTGSLTGAVINFQVSRAVGQAKVQKRLNAEEYKRLSVMMQKYGAYTIILTRMAPLLMETTSSLAGLSKMKLRTFLLMNIVGFAPMTFLYSYAGALYKHEQPYNLLIVLIAGFLAPLTIWYFLLSITKADNRFPVHHP